MHPENIRRLILEVDPPGSKKDLTVNKEDESALSEIPFWKPLFKDFQPGEGADEFYLGIFETFVRFYRTLRAANCAQVLHDLALEDVYAADTELREGRSTITDEYPTLEMMGVTAKGAFGAGICLAYALLEKALEKMDAAEERLQNKPPIVETGGAAELVEIFEEPSGGNDPPFGDAAYAPLGGSLNNLKDHEKMKTMVKTLVVPSKAKPLPACTLQIYKMDGDAWRLEGDVMPTMKAVAETYEVVKALFDVDPSLEKGTTGFVFAFHVLPNAKGKS